MKVMPPIVADFLTAKRIAVAGVSRDPHEAANAIYRKLRRSGYEVLAINPRAATVEGDPCYPDLRAAPGPIDGLIVVSPAHTALELVRQSAQRGVPRVWLHRSLGTGSVSPDAVRECRAHRIGCLVGGCPLLYVEPVDPAHRCLRWVLRWSGRLPGASAPPGRQGGKA